MLDSLDQYIGPAAGLATSVLWTLTSIFFTAAGKRIGATLVNSYRIAMAIVLLGIIHRLLSGAWIPEVVSGQVAFLAVSGIVGLSIGDQALFTAFIFVGPRISVLIMATSPIFAVLFGALVLGESLSLTACIGIALTLSGVAWVILERPNKRVSTAPSRRGLGIACGFIGAACQAGGLLLSKQGMGHGWLPEAEHLDPQAATFIRVCFAGLGMIPIVLIHRWWFKNHRSAAPIDFKSSVFRAGLFFTACGAVVGPCLGIWMSLVASDRAPLGVAQTLCSLMPIFILPFAVIIHKERLSFRAVLGAFIAVGGSALLFFYPQ